MGFSTRNLNRLGNSFQIPLPVDEDGLTGRECPDEKCLGYFKIKFGTGLKGSNLPCHCPYCGYIADHQKFFTEEQNSYALSVVKKEIFNAISKDVLDWDHELRNSTKNSFIKMSASFSHDHHPIQYYKEKELETNVVCENCTLEYAIYGVFAYCPDCGEHNSFQILKKNFEIIKKEIALSEKSEDEELSRRLLEDALSNSVSSFDGFGRSIFSAYSTKAKNPEQAKNISLQNIQVAHKRVEELFGCDFAKDIDLTNWEMIIKCFQKRHLVIHKMGVVDKEYLEKTKDTTSFLGRKINISHEEVLSFLDLLEKLGFSIKSQFSEPKQDVPE
jgi:hypothetical protein